MNKMPCFFLILKICKIKKLIVKKNFFNFLKFSFNFFLNRTNGTSQTLKRVRWIMLLTEIESLLSPLKLAFSLKIALMPNLLRTFCKFNSVTKPNLGNFN